MRVLLAFLLFTAPVYAAEQCVDLDVSSWTQKQKNLLEAESYRMVWLVDNNMQPPTSVDRKEGVVCFTNPTIDVSTVLTESSVVAQHNIWKAERDSARAAALAKHNEYETERSSNTVCGYDLDQAQTAIDAVQAEIDASSNLAEAKAALSSVFNITKKLAKCFIVTTRQGL